MTFPTVVAFSWGRQHFHDAAEKLKAQCGSFGLPHRISVRADLSAHFAACPGEPWEAKRWCYRYIPGFILEELDKGPEDLLYLHADYRIRAKVPNVFKGLDIGLQKRWAWRVEQSILPALAAPVFVRNNERARRFVRHWRTRCLEVDDGGGEHGPLLESWRLFRKRDRSIVADWFPANIASQAADADCAIIGHKREPK